MGQEDTTGASGRLKLLYVEGRELKLTRAPPVLGTRVPGDAVTSGRLCAHGSCWADSCQVDTPSPLIQLAVTWLPVGSHCLGLSFLTCKIALKISRVLSSSAVPRLSLGTN